MQQNISVNEENKLKAYAQWVQISITPKGFDLVIKNVEQLWGKFYSGTKDNEVNIGNIEGHKVLSGETYIISSCGRENASSGTEGSFDIYDSKNDKKVGNYYWSCPWGSKTNTSTWKEGGYEDYITQVTGGNLDSGALGNIFIKVAYLG